MASYQLIVIYMYMKWNGTKARHEFSVIFVGVQLADLIYRIIRKLRNVKVNYMKNIDVK